MEKTAATRLSSGDIQREMGISRAVLDRLIRDNPQLAPLETVGGSRLWPAEAIDLFRAAIQRDREARR